MKSNKLLGILFLFLGVALIFSGYILYRQETNNETVAKKASAQILEEIKAQISIHSQEGAAIKQPPINKKTISPQEALLELEREMVQYQGTEEKTANIFKEEEDIIEYYGYLSIPALGLELPIGLNWSYPRLKKVPCRYNGSIEEENLVIAAHNYDAHFGNLKSLSAGDSIIFTAMDGNTYEYAVEYIEFLEKNQNSILIEGQYALTLFTCTYGGEQRVVVRCYLQNSIK